MVDQKLLNDTLQKIHASLNRRYEKDAALYISRQDENDLKKHLCNNAYAMAADMAKAKGINHDIVVKVILRNASLMDVKDTKRFHKELRSVLADADYTVLEHMMEDVFANNVYMQKVVRHILFSYYMGGIPVEKCIDYWESDTQFDSHERLELYKRILEKSEEGGALRELDSKIAFMQRAFQRFPVLMKEWENGKRKTNGVLMLADCLTASEKADFFPHLSREMACPSIRDDLYKIAIQRAYESYGEQAYNDAVSQIRSGGPQRDDAYKRYISSIRTLLTQEKDLDRQLHMFDTLYQVYNQGYLRTHISREIERKVWPTAKKQAGLYEARRPLLDHLVEEGERETECYTSFDDVVRDLEAGVNPKSIAFLWLRMPSPTFEESLKRSFHELGWSFIDQVQPVYDWLFRHKFAHKQEQGLTEICEKIAGVLLSAAQAGEDSEYFQELDRCWLSNVMKSKLRGEKIKRYVYAEHYDKAKEWEQ